MLRCQTLPQFEHLLFNTAARRIFTIFLILSPGAHGAITLTQSLKAIEYYTSINHNLVLA
jgi:hypothetical protein